MADAPSPIGVGMRSVAEVVRMLICVVGMVDILDTNKMHTTRFGLVSDVNGMSSCIGQSPPPITGGSRTAQPRKMSTRSALVRSLFCVRWWATCLVTSRTTKSGSREANGDRGNR